MNLPAGTDRAPVALAAADKKAAADLADRAVPTDANWLKDLFAGIGNQSDEQEADLSDAGIDDFDYAFAKPATKGGNGRGKDKNNDGTDSGGTDSGGTDSGGGDTGGGDTGGSDPNVYVSGLDTPNGFNIEIEFTGSWTDTYKQIVKDAAEHFSDIITGDIASYNGVDDFKLLAIMNDVDGAGGILGVGGTMTERPGSYLPSNGFLRIDQADAAGQLQQGTLQDVVLHEVMHSLGFGTIWSELGLVQSIGGSMRFTGANAIQAYNDDFADIAANDPYASQGVKISGDGSHWDHATFTHEVMTPSIYGSGNYISDMSIAALQDMGYETVYGDSVLVG
ncbi:hypothetical protein ACFMPD_14250 [Sedimentitalea sp. HM32M-2]|uniref:hypothetical protein n=1 Tax=Sedimentitalea sp. HM32M-2 TaxID=3351566 RepID=UPI00363D5D7E